MSVLLHRGAITRTVTIANGATTSGAVTALDSAMYGIILPAAFTGTSLTFTVCDTDTGTYQALYDQYGNAVSMTVAQGRSYTAPAELTPWPYFKIVSGSSEGGARSIKVVRKA